MTEAKTAASTHRRVVYVDTVAELKTAISNTDRDVIVRRSLDEVPTLRLERGCSLAGITPEIALTFAVGADGVELSRDNSLSALMLRADGGQRAIYNRDDERDLGNLNLISIVATGQVQIIARNKTQTGKISIDGLHVKFANAVERLERPSSGTSGVGTSNIDVLQGALTILNLQKNKSSVLYVDARRISIGTPEQPVYGSGILISGGGGNIYTHPGETFGGRVDIEVLETSDVYNDSRIVPGTADLVTGSVFVAYADAKLVINSGRTISYGVNGLGLDNWGRTGQWFSIGPVETFGDSGMGAVNFGVMDHFAVASIETHGVGARTYNILTGTVGATYFGWLRTHGDGATAILIQQPVGTIVVNDGIETFGRDAESLASGFIYMQPSACIRFNGGSADSIHVGGDVVTRGPSSSALDLTGATIGKLTIGGRVLTNGEASHAFRVVASKVPLVGIEARSSLATAVLLDNADLSEMVAVRAHGHGGDVDVRTDSRVVTTATSVEQLSGEFGNAFVVSGPGRLILEAPTH